MGKNIFCALIIVGFCFGQSIWLKENPKINLPMPISSANGTNEIAMGKISFYSAQNLSLVKSLSPNVLFMQVESESLQPKTSIWKQAGIYGLEFVGAGVVTLPITIVYQTLFYFGEIDNCITSKERTTGLILTGITNSLLASTSTWLIGKCFRQHGSWWTSMIGAGIGSYISVTIGGANFFKEGFVGGMGVTIFFISCPLGAVIMYNL